MLSTTSRGSKKQFKISELASTEVFTSEVFCTLCKTSFYIKNISEFEETQEETPSPVPAPPVINTPYNAAEVGVSNSVNTHSIIYRLKYNILLTNFWLRELSIVTM